MAAAMAGDQDIGRGAEHRRRFAQDQFDQTRILARHGGQLDRLGPGRDRRQIDKAAFRLGHDLLGDDEDIVGWNGLNAAVAAASSAARAAPGATSGSPCRGRTSTPGVTPPPASSLPPAGSRSGGGAASFPPIE